MIGNYFRASNIKKKYDAIVKRYETFYLLAKTNKDDDALNYLGKKVKPKIEEFNNAYLEDDKPTKAMVELFDTTLYCFEKSESIYKIGCKEPHYKTLMDLLLVFLSRDFLRNGRKGALTKEQVTTFHKRFDIYYAIIERLADKSAQIDQYNIEIKEARKELAKSESIFTPKSQKEIISKSATSKYNSAVYFYNNYKKSIEADLNQLRTLQAKEINEFLYNDTIAANVHENVGQALFVQEQMNQDYQSIEKDTNELFGDSASMDLPQLKPVEKATPEIMDQLSKFFDGFEKAMIANHNDIKKEFELTRSQEQSHFDELSNKMDNLREELKKLDNNELIQKIAAHFESVVQKEEQPEQDVCAQQETIVYQEELKDRKLSTNDIINTLLEMDPPASFSGACAIIRSLINAWCSYMKHVPLEASERIFRIKNNDGEFIQTRRELLEHLFGEQDGDSIDNIYAFCSKSIHGNVTADITAETIREYQKTIIDELGFDFSKINYMDGVKELYKQEVESINRLVDVDYDVPDELTDPSKSPQELRKYAMRRFHSYRNYLSGHNVDNSFFRNIGRAKDFPNNPQ